MINDRISKFIEISWRLNELAHSVIDDLSTKHSSRLSSYLYFAGIKAQKSHKAVLILAAEDLGEDAAILSRTLYELAVNTLYIARDETGRSLERFQSYELILWERDLSPHEDAEWPGMYEDIHRRAEEARRTYRYQPGRWSELGFKAMAEEVSMPDFVMYKHICNYVHSNAAILTDYGDESVYGNMIPIATTVSFDALYLLTVTVNEMSQIGRGGEIEEVRKAFSDHLLSGFHTQQWPRPPEDTKKE